MTRTRTAILLGLLGLVMLWPAARLARSLWFRHVLAEVPYADSVDHPALDRAVLFNAEAAEHDHLQPLDEPVWVAGRDGDHLRDDDVVLAFEVDGQAYAIPWWVMKNHHVANLDFGHTARMIAFCERCSSAAAFDPTIGSTRHTARVVGRYNGTILLADSETGSHWEPFTGRALHGPLAGMRMDRRPLFQTSWRRWLDEHPATWVVDGHDGMREGHAPGQVPGGPGLGRMGERTLLVRDGRLGAHAMVLGVEAGGVSRAYPLATLERIGPALNVDQGGEALVVLHDPGSLMASAFSREVDGEVLEFERTEGGDVVDRQTGSGWQPIGRASTGPLAGRSLRWVHSGVEEWYAWAASHPGTEVFGLDGAEAGAAGSAG